MIRTSPFGTLPIPEVAVGDHVLGGLTVEDRDRISLIEPATGLELTYLALAELVEAFASRLASEGIAEDEVVALLAPNGAAFVVAFHGVVRLGAVASPLNVLYTPHEIAAQLRSSRAGAIVTVPEMQDVATSAADLAGLAVDRVLTVQHTDLTHRPSPSRPAPRPRIDPASDLAILPYSSGTTGLAKGVMLTHRNLVANLVQCEHVLDVHRDDVVLAVLPFFHIYGLNVLMNLTLRARATLITMPRFDLETFLRTIQERRCTYLFIAPPMAVALAKHPMVDEFDLSSLRIIISGAAPLDADLGNALRKRLDCAVLQGYGMTELSPVSHVIPPSEPGLSLGSIGIPLPNVEFKVVDPVSGRAIPPQEDGSSSTGELWIRGPIVMRGYLNDDRATSETIDSEGFLHTGDLVRVGQHGEVYVVDRLKELIKYKGYQVAPAELEAVLLSHPAIADAAVVPQPDADAGERPHAFIVLQPDSGLTERDVIDFVADRVAPHKKVRGVTFCAAIPKSAAGKILRKELRLLLQQRPAVNCADS